jgi:hypothetical protein
METRLGTGRIAAPMRYVTVEGRDRVQSGRVSESGSVMLEPGTPGWLSPGRAGG